MKSISTLQGAQLQSNVWLPLLRYTCIASPHNSSIVLVHLWHPEAGEPGMFCDIYLDTALYSLKIETDLHFILLAFFLGCIA